MTRIEESWGYTLSKISQKMDQEFSQKLNKINIDARDYGILCNISNVDLSQKEIGERMKIDRTTVVQIIDNLEKKALVSRVSNPKDRRQNIIKPTPKGQEIVSSMWQVLELSEKEIISELEDYQKEALITISKLLEEKKA